MEKYFEELYKEHYRLVVKTAYSVLRDVSASQDIASEVFLKLLENLMIKKDIKNVKAWLCIVAKYTAYDYLKAKNWKCLMRNWNIVFKMKILLLRYIQNYLLFP